MGKTTGIEWTDATWNPIRGCTRVSEGCRNCYAEKVAARFSGPGRPFEGLAEFVTLKPAALGPSGTPLQREARWTGKVVLIEKHLEDPIRWKEPMKIFVNSMSDLFHPAVEDDWVTRIFQVMARAPQHTYQILTKRPERMLSFLEANLAISDDFTRIYGQSWPPPNWWFGVSVEDDQTAKKRIPILADCVAAVRFVSYEPALGSVNWNKIFPTAACLAAIDWIICGGESGTNARPLHPDWARSARDAASSTGIPFFFKQWGEFLPGGQENNALLANQERSSEFDRLGKKAAGAMLDGREWREFPEHSEVAA